MFTRVISIKTGGEVCVCVCVPGSRATASVVCVIGSMRCCPSTLCHMDTVSQLGVQVCVCVCVPVSNLSSGPAACGSLSSPLSPSSKPVMQLFVRWLVCLSALACVCVSAALVCVCVSAAGLCKLRTCFSVCLR